MLDEEGAEDREEHEEHHDAQAEEQFLVAHGEVEELEAPGLSRPGTGGRGGFVLRCNELVRPENSHIGLLGAAL